MPTKATLDPVLDFTPKEKKSGFALKKNQILLYPYEFPDFDSYTLVHTVGSEYTERKN